MFSAVFPLLVAAVTVGAALAPAAEPSPVLPSSATPAGSTVARQQAPAPEEKVDLNSATAEDLEKVPGIGPTLAERIVAFRDEHGRFEKVDDLLNVRGIGTRSLERIRPHVKVEESDGADPVVPSVAAVAAGSGRK